MLTNNIIFKKHPTHSTQKNGANSNFKNTLIPPLANDTISFSSQLLYKANIKRINENGEEELVPAKITKLNHKDQEDIHAMKSIRLPWIKTPYIVDIAMDFESNYNKNNFLALEIDDDKKELKDKILCLAEITSRPAHTHMGYHDTKVEYLQASPCAEYGKNNKYKGSGEVLMYGICRKAKDSRFSEVTLQSTNHPFYNRIGMPKALEIGSGYYAFKKASLDRFLEKVEEKYQIPASNS